MARVRAIINKQEIKGITNVNEFYSLVLQMVEVNSLSTLQTLKEHIQTVFDLVDDFCTLSRESAKGAKKASFTRTKTRIANNRRYWNRIRDRKIFMRRYYDLVLSVEKLGTLPGFGFRNRFGDQIMGNAEKVSNTNGRNLLRE